MQGLVLHGGRGPAKWVKARDGAAVPRLGVRSLTTEQGEPPLRASASSCRSPPASRKRSHGPGCRPRAPQGPLWPYVRSWGRPLHCSGFVPPPWLEDDAPPEGWLHGCPGALPPLRAPWLGCSVWLFQYVFTWPPWVLIAAVAFPSWLWHVQSGSRPGREPGALRWELRVSALDQQGSPGAHV